MSSLEEKANKVLHSNIFPLRPKDVGVYSIDAIKNPFFSNSPTANQLFNDEIIVQPRSIVLSHVLKKTTSATNDGITIFLLEPSSRLPSLPYT